MDIASATPKDRLRRVIQASPSSDPASAYKRVELQYNDRGQLSTVYRQSETPGNYEINSYYSYDGLGRQTRQLDWLISITAIIV